MTKDNAIIKVDSTENWAKARNYIPDKFTIIVYQDEDAAPKIKIGDGIHTVGTLPFLVEREVENTTLKI